VLVVSSEGSQVKEAAAFQRAFTRFVVHWTCGPIPPDAYIIPWLRALYTTTCKNLQDQSRHRPGC
jgi:hypothetical protein